MKSLVSGAVLICLAFAFSEPFAAAEPEPAPLYRVTLVARTTQAVNYSSLRGSTRIDFRGTPLLARGEGKANIANRGGAIEIDAEFENLEPATQFGGEYLTFVMWAITPEGRATNLGELLLDYGDSKLKATTELRVFALVVTAEPHFAVTQPSNVVVLENVVRPDTSGKIQQVNAKYELLERGHYTLQVEPAGQVKLDPKVPLELRQARRALALARSAGAERHASDTYQRAAQLLANAEKERRKKRVARIAREAVQTAEDARLIALKRGEEERLAEERRASADRESRARAEAAQADLERQRSDQARLEAEARADAERARAEAERTRGEALNAAEEGRRRAEAELERQRSDQARLETEQARAEAERARADAERIRGEALSEAERAARERQDAEAARQAAEAQQQAAQTEAAQARQMAQEAERLRLEAERDRGELRARLQEQLNRILETRDTARGLVVNMSDVLFASGQYNLQPGAREKLAKIAGIVLSHPGLQLEVEGHTDSVGAEEYNQRLSERRADAVRAYLLQNGVTREGITAHGFGETRPVTSNDTAVDRQHNRRVEIVVTGEPIGVATR